MLPPICGLSLTVAEARALYASGLLLAQGLIQQAKPIDHPITRTRAEIAFLTYQKALRDLIELVDPSSAEQSHLAVDLFLRDATRLCTLGEDLWVRALDVGGMSPLRDGYAKTVQALLQARNPPKPKPPATSRFWIVASIAVAGGLVLWLGRRRA